MLSRLTGIYHIKNIINNKIYIGSAADFYERWHSHNHYLNSGNHHNVHLQRAFEKYGRENFIFEIIEIVEDKSKLIEREQYYIDTLKPEYNIRKDATSNLGIKFSIEHRAKLSAWQIGNKLSKETKYKISKTLSGRIISEEIRIRMGAAHRKLDKWPCLDGWKCKCKDCKKKRSNYMKERRRNH